MDCRARCWRFSARLSSTTIFFCFIRSPCLFRLYHSVTAECPWFLRGRDRRLPMVRRCPQIRVGSRSLHMFILCGYWWDVPIVFRRLLLRRWTHVDASVSVVTYSIYGGVVDHRRVVNVVDVGDVHIRHDTVIEEVSIVPASAGKAQAEITESIIDPTLKTYLRPPATHVPGTQ